MKLKEKILLTLPTAAAEFGVDRRVLERSLADINAMPIGGKFTIRDCHNACSGDIEAQKLRLVREQADSVAIKNATARGELVELTAVTSHMENVFVSIRSGILASGLLSEEKNDLLKTLKKLTENVAGKITIEDGAGDGDDEGGEGVSSTAEVDG